MNTVVGCPVDIAGGGEWPQSGEAAGNLRVGRQKEHKLDLTFLNELPNFSKTVLASGQMGLIIH